MLHNQRKSQLENLEIKERNILRKILDPIPKDPKNNEFHRRPIKNLDQTLFGREESFKSIKNVKCIGLPKLLSIL